LEIYPHLISPRRHRPVETALFSWATRQRPDRIGALEAANFTEPNFLPLAATMISILALGHPGPQSTVLQKDAARSDHRNCDLSCVLDQDE
jgi:hypothetical protein